MFSKMDQLFHTNKSSDTAAVYKQYTKEYMQFELESEGLNMNASFEHLGK